MTRDEALEKVTDPEAKQFITKIITDQNSYITKLEAQLKDATSKNATNAGGLDDVTRQYLEKNMREDVISKAKAIIVKGVGLERYTAVEADYLKFLAENMDRPKTTVEFAVDAFNLVHGRCQMDPNHAVNKIGKAPTPGSTPNPTPGTNGQAVQNVQDILANAPTAMNGKDSNSQTGVPENKTDVKSTNQAFDVLRRRFSNSGGDRFQ